MEIPQKKGPWHRLGIFHSAPSQGGFQGAIAPCLERFVLSCSVILSNHCIYGDLSVGLTARGVAHRWRKPLGVTRTSNDGSQRLIHAASERGAERER
jgi:hypothetical protein